MNHTDALIADNGNTQIGALWSRKCVATVVEQSITLAILLRCDGKTLQALNKRLDQAIANAYDFGCFTDEVNHQVVDADRKLTIGAKFTQIVYTTSVCRRRSGAAGLLANANTAPTGARKEAIRLFS